MRHDRAMERRRRQSSGISVWSVIGGLALLATAAAVVVSLPDIKRYIKISTM